MKTEWKIQQLSNIVEFNPKETLKKGVIAKKISMDKLQPFCRDICEYELTKFTGGTKFRNGDTIMARITPCLENGKTAKINILDNGEIGFGSTEYIVFRAKEGISDPDFIYYLVTSSLIREPAIKSMVGSSGRQRVQSDVVEKIKINLPPLPVQKKIASILKSLDDKIELNRQISKNLEEQAWCLFNEQFDKANDQLPDRWQIADIYSITNVIYGAPFASNLFNTEGNGKPIIRIRDLQSQNFTTYTTENHPKGYLLQRGDIVVGMDGEFRPYIWGNDEAWLNQRICVFENKRTKGKFFLYFTLLPLLNFIEETEMATTVIHIGKKDFDAFRIILPDEQTLNNYDELTMPMFEQIVANKKEIAKLTQIRDTILPKLMSGEIEV